MDNPKTTALGTPASSKWDDDWIAEVDRVEAALGRRICGAHTPAWTPCKLGSNHPNGRCRFHGGAPGIGAPKGNRNALVHGLYSRRLQQCGSHCPLWQSCPMAGRDVIALEPRERPHCVYEKEEYDHLIAGMQPAADPNVCHPQAALVGAGSGEEPSDFQRTLAELEAEHRAKESRPPAREEPAGLVQRNVAMFQVMLTRAQAALSVTELTDQTHAEGDRYRMTSTRVGALLQAQLRIARELRQWLRLLLSDTLRASAESSPTPDDEPMGLPDIMKPILEKAEGFVEEVLTAGAEEEDDGEDFPGGPVEPAPGMA